MRFRTLLSLNVEIFNSINYRFFEAMNDVIKIKILFEQFSNINRQYRTCRVKKQKARYNILFSKINN